MISVSEALALVTCHTSLLPPVEIPLGKALGLVLAADVPAASSVPPFHQSAMDGYAFRYEEYGQTKTFSVIGEVAAGDNAEDAFQPRSAVRIFTGAPLPRWADTVVMQEKTEIIAGQLTIHDEELVRGSNVRTQGYEIRAGELALPKETKLTPAAIGFLAGVGTTTVKVYPKPSVHIIVTGNELQQPGNPLEPGQVYESNSLMLQTALHQLGIENVGVQQVGDDTTALRDAVRSALENADLLLLTGGVSVGNYDYVVQAAEACGVEQLFHKVAQRPGKPLFAGKKKNKMIFGLPGNPASVLTCFYVYVVAAIESLTGRKDLLRKKYIPLSLPLSKKIKLTQFLKAVHYHGEVMPLPAQESFRLSSFSVANCLIVLPEQGIEFAKGEPVETILLPYL